MRTFLVFLVAVLILLGVCFWGGRFGLPGDAPLQVPWLSEGTLPAGGFILLWGATWLAGLAVLVLFPRGLRFRQSALLVLTLALFCRLLLLGHPPSDDVNRYLWEGRLVAAGFSPYAHPPRAPDDPEVDFLRDPDDPYWAHVNHPEITAIYPPGMLLLFAVVASVSYTAGAIKAVMIACDLGTVALLLLLLRERRLDPRWALVYALNPVILYAFAGHGHLDAVQILLVVAAVVLYRHRRWGWMFLLAGLAVEAKYVAVIAWPLLVRRDNLRWAWIAPAAAAAPALVFLPGDGLAIFDTFIRFGRDFAFNGPVHGLLRHALDGIEPATRVCLAAFAAIWLLGSWHSHPARRRSPYADPSAGLFLVVAAFLLLAPTVHFWYLSLLVPFLALRPKGSWLLLTATIAFTFVAAGYQHHTGIYRFPAWAQLAVWVLPLAVMLAELPIVLSRLRNATRWPPPRTVSAVVPVRNEAAGIAGCVDSIRADPAVTEVLVVDGGSSDGTPEVARAHGARVISHPAPFDGGGRGGQILTGCREATGDVVAVVHADARVTPGVFCQVLATLGQNGDAVGGAIGAVFDGRGLKLRLVECANDFRAAFLGISFGDQVQFFRREPVMSRNLYPGIALMEDVELSLRLQRLGRQVFLWGRNLASARRWRSGRRFLSLLVLRLTAEYLVRRLWGQPDTVAMYRRYYRRRPSDREDY